MVHKFHPRTWHWCWKCRRHWVQGLKCGANFLLWKQTYLGARQSECLQYLPNHCPTVDDLRSRPVYIINTNLVLIPCKKNSDKENHVKYCEIRSWLARSQPVGTSETKAKQLLTRYRLTPGLVGGFHCSSTVLEFKTLTLKSWTESGWTIKTCVFMKLA